METEHGPDDVMIYEYDGPGTELEAQIYGDIDIVQAVKAFTTSTGRMQQPTIFDHPAFSDLRGASISASTAHA